MKYLIYFICLILLSCEKEGIEPLNPINPIPFISHRDTSHFKTGRYRGETHLIIPGQEVDKIQPAYREIVQVNNDYLVRWWSAPDTTALATISDTLHYTMVFDVTNTSCGLQRFVYDYTVTSYRINDSIFESGTVRHRWYYNNQLMKDMQGTFESRLKFIDNKTPNYQINKP